MDQVTKVNTRELKEGIANKLGVELNEVEESLRTQQPEGFETSYLQALIESNLREFDIFGGDDRIRKSPDLSKFDCETIDRAWRQVSDAYLDWIDWNIKDLKDRQGEEYTKEWLRNEFRRFTLAKFFQLNKFTASAEMVNRNIEYYLGEN